MAYENGIKKARFGKKKIEHATKQIKRNRQIQDDKIIEVHRLIEDEKNFATDLDLKNKELVQKMVEFETLYPEYLLVLEKQGVLQNNIRLTSAGIEQTSKRLIDAQQHNNQAASEMKLVETRVRVAKEELDFEKSEGEHLLSNLDQRMDRDDLNLKNKKMANDLLRTAIEDLKLNIYDKGALIFDLGEQAKDKEQEVRNLDRETSEIATSVLRQKAEFKGLQEQITILNDQLSTTQFELSSAQTKDKDLSALISREHKRIDDLEIPGIEVDLQSEIERLTEQKKELNFEIEQLDPVRETYEHEKREFLMARQKHADRKEDYRQKMLDLEKV